MLIAMSMSMCLLDVDVAAHAVPHVTHTTQFKKKKESLKAAQKQEIFDRYGGVDHLKSLPKELLFAQSEQYAEYG